MLAQTLALSLLCAVRVFAQAVNATSRSAPTATVKNGTYVGRYLGSSWDQDAFLGIPYAQPPVGPARFKRPLSLNTSFSETRDASVYGFSCEQNSAVFNMSEDCLTLNVVRPSGTTSRSSLPVLVWIYGGGLTSGSSADPQYNVSGVVRLSQDIEERIIVTSINYRLGLWGFLAAPEVLSEGSTNAGLFDQRLALQWIKENIAAFGGNPEKITIWGESAGAQSIGMQTHAFGGRNDDLFRAAIMESGGAIGTPLHPLPYYTVAYQNLTNTLGCSSASSPLACLRQVPAAALATAAFNDVGGIVWNPLVDGDFFTAFPSTQMAEPDAHTPVPLLIGTNSDEGTSFIIADGLNTDEELFDASLIYRTYSLSPPSIQTLLDLYPLEPTEVQGETFLPYPPVHLPQNATLPSDLGAQYRRASAIGGDITMHSGRRKTCVEYTQPNQTSSQTVYSYRFDTPPWNGSVFAGAQHGVNVMFSFQNISGALGPLPQFQSHLDLARAIGRAYIGFVATGDVNTYANKTIDGEGGVLPEWPTYNDVRQNMVLNSNGSWVEDDTWRAEGIAFINTIDRELLA